MAFALRVALAPDDMDTPPSAIEQSLPERNTERVAETSAFSIRSIGNRSLRDSAAVLSPEEEAARRICQELDVYIDNLQFHRALEEARNLSKHEDSQVRKLVVEALDWIGTAALFDLAGMMSDTDAKIADLAGTSFWTNLDNLQNNDLKLELLDIPLHSPDPAKRIDAIEELGFMPPAYSVPYLIQALTDQNPDVRLAVRDNLWFLSGGEAFSTPEQWSQWYTDNRAALIREIETDTLPKDPT